MIWLEVFLLSAKRPGLGVRAALLLVRKLLIEGYCLPHRMTTPPVNPRLFWVVEPKFVKV
jgi:hypothetical protein